MTGMLTLVAMAWVAQPQVKEAEKAAQMTEDVEVMRRLLNKTLGVPNEAPAGHAYADMAFMLGYPNTAVNNLNRANTAGWLVNPNLPPNPHVTFGQPTPQYFAAYDVAGYNRVRVADPFDGVYLAGHGVVYTLRVRPGEMYSVGETKKATHLTSTCTHCHADVPTKPSKLVPDGGTAAPVSEWQRTRDDLLGKKPVEPAARTTTVEPGAMCRPGTLTEAVIDVLEKNGKHLRHLAAGENVTVVVTLDGLYGPARSAADGQQPADKQVLTTDERKMLDVGDLHAKNGKHKEAAAAYSKALARFPNAEVVFRGWSADTDTATAEKLRTGFVTLRRKLAASLLNIDDDPAAVEAARKVVELAAATKVTFAGAESKSVAVPAKVVVSVRKSDLADAGTMAAGAFRKKVSVTTTGFPPADKK